MYVERQELRGLGTCCPARTKETPWMQGVMPLTPSRHISLRVNSRRNVQGDHGLVKEREDGKAQLMWAVKETYLSAQRDQRGTKRWETGIEIHDLHNCNWRESSCPCAANEM